MATEDHEKITGFAGLSPILACDLNCAGRSGHEDRTERAFPDAAGRIGRFPTGLNPPSSQEECGFKSRPGHHLPGILLSLSTQGVGRKGDSCTDPAQKSCESRSGIVIACGGLWRLSRVSPVASGRER